MVEMLHLGSAASVLAHKGRSEGSLQGSLLSPSPHHRNTLLFGTKVLSRHSRSKCCSSFEVDRLFLLANEPRNLEPGQGTNLNDVIPPQKD